MDKLRQKRRKTTAVKINRRKTNQSTAKEEQEIVINEFDILGISKVTLSPMTQTTIGAVIGENITAEHPWMYVKKEIVADNLELHEESSEFLPIKEEILHYPETKLLLGYDASLTSMNKNDGDLFYVCTTIEAKETVLNILAKQLEIMQERLKKSVEKTPGEWATMGSETEIDENIIRDLRSKIQIEVVSKYPLSDTKVKFAMRPVEAARDGYVELLPNRFECDNIYRMRVDAEVQAAPKTINNEAQTNPTYPLKNWTQYQFDYKEPVLNAAKYKTIAGFIQKRMDELCDTILVNEEINLHTNDYEKLVKRIRPPVMTFSREMLSFQDVVSCKGKRVSSMSWNPTMSGIIAVSYCNTPLSTIYTEPPNMDQSFRKIYDQNLVLIWCYEDPLLPKLYLHSDREVNCVRFCPHDGNILVGGCENGQIVVWDLTNKIADVENKEILTPSEQNNKCIIHSLMHWLKDTRDKAVVHPTIVSLMDYSQTFWITNIFWVSANNQFTVNGKIEDIDPEEGRSCQFVSASLDGSLCVWDLKKIPLGQIGPVRTIKISARVSERPSALTIETSKLKALDKMLIPIYKVTLDDSRGQVPISCIYMKLPRYEYNAHNPETATDPLQRTYFDVGELEDDFQLEANFIAASSIGYIYDFNIVGYDYDLGQKVNSGPVHVTAFQSIHDGPIKAVYTNPFFDNLLLTIGGRVFAVWDKCNPEEPYFWRKSKIRYVFGLWSSNLPSILAIGRIDFNFEIWDLTRRSKNPTKVIHLAGNIFLDGYTDALKGHSRKNTVCIIDAVGALKVYNLPDYFIHIDLSQIKVITKVLSRIDKRRKTLKQWQLAWMKKHIPAEPIVEETVIQAPLKQEPPQQEEETEKNRLTMSKKLNTLDKIMLEKWNAKQEKFMYDVLLEKKKINLAEMELQKIPLQKLADDARYRSDKEKEIMSRRDTIFESAKNMILKEDVTERGDRISTYRIPVEFEAAIKCKYVTNYKINEELIIDSINKNKYRYRFYWTNMINIAKERQRQQYDVFVRKKQTLNVNSLTEISNYSQVTESYSTTNSFKGSQ